MGTIILIVIIITTIFLGKYALKTGMALERNKLIKNINNYEQKEREKQSKASSSK